MLNITGSPDLNNPELVTLQQAKDLAAAIGSIAGGVTNIYIPPYALASPPVDGQALFYHFTFANGASGFNAGTIWQDMIVFRYTWPAMLATSVNYQVPPENAIPIPPTLNIPGPSPAPPPTVTVWPSKLPPGWVMTPFGPSGPAGSAPVQTGTPGVNPTLPDKPPIN